MKVFTESEIKEYQKYIEEVFLPGDEEVKMRCHICGRLLSESELPEGPEKLVTCLADRDYFVEQFESYKESGDF